MNKKGQIYLIVSLIIGLVIFVLTSQPNIINARPQNQDFKLISQNYNHESSKFLASIIQEGVESNKIEEKFVEFSVFFTQYSKSQNPSFGLIYLLNYENKVYAGNFFDKKVTLTFLDENGMFESTKDLEGCFGDITAGIGYEAGSLKLPISYQTFNQKQCITSKSFSEEKDRAVTLSIENENDILYEVNLISGQPEVIVISRENVAEDRKVFVEKQFIKGKKNRNNRR